MPISPLIRPKIRNRRMGFNSAFLPPPPRPPGAKMSALTLIVPELLLFCRQEVISAIIFPVTGDIYEWRLQRAALRNRGIIQSSDDEPLFRVTDRLTSALARMIMRDSLA